MDTENKCKGCIYDTTDKDMNDKNVFNSFIENCCACKRGVREEAKDWFVDGYQSC